MVVLRALLAARWLYGAMVLPYAMLIARLPAGGGWPAALALTLAVLYALACLDVMVLSRERERRLAIIQGRGLADQEALAVIRFALGGLAALLSIVVLLVQPWIGLTLLAALVLIRLGLGSEDAARTGLAFRWIELTLPIAALVLPYLLTRGYSAQQLRDQAASAFNPDQAGALASAPLDHCTLPAVALGASMLGCVVLLCVLRDEALDRGTRIKTSATSIGRTGAALVLALMTCVTGVLAIGGAAGSCWPWLVGAVTLALAQLALWSVFTRAERFAAPVWALSCALIGWMLLVS